MRGRTLSLGEKVANSVSHGAGLLAAIVGVPFLVAAAGGSGSANAAGVIVFAATMVLLYLASTRHHALPAGRAKQVFLRLNHGAIYLFIAGSCTPFALGALGGPYGWMLLAAIWGLAALGISLKGCDRLAHPCLSPALYLAMGWLVLFAAGPLVERVPATGIGLLVAGGLAYSAGVAFFMLDSRWRHAHVVWYGFVMTGTAFHFVAVLHYSA